MHNEPFSPVCFFRFFRSDRYKALKYDYEIGWYWSIWLKLACCGGKLPLKSDLWKIAGASTERFFNAENARVMACFETREVDGKLELYSETLSHSLEIAERLRVAANSTGIHKPKRPYKEVGSRFVVPSIQDVRTYCEERNNNINPELFVDFYTARGWKVGKSPMKDWRAAVRTWEKNRGETEFCSDPQHHGLNNRGGCWICGKRKST